MIRFNEKEYVEVHPDEILRKKFLSGEIGTEEYIYLRELNQNSSALRYKDLYKK